ncbi:MAG TPA: DUF222 domain-containing protein, partial [Streptosporangiaceae bacterium]
QVLGELARLVGLADSTGAFAAAGYSSAAAFLRHGCGRAPGRAGELAALGRGLPRLRATQAALAAGELSFDAAQVICRAVAQIDDEALAAAAEKEMLVAATTGLPGSRSAAEAVGSVPGTGDGDRDRDRDSTQDPAGENEKQAPGSGPGAAHGSPAEDRTAHRWVAPGLDPRELRRLGEDLAYRAGPDAVEERQRKRFERRYLCFGLTLDDVGTISGACSDTLSLEIIRTAAEAFSPPGGPGDHRTAAQRRMDGLTAACQAALDSGTAGHRHGAMPHLSILLDAPTPPGGPRDPAGPLSGPAGPGSHPGPDPVQAGSGLGSGLARTGNGALLTARQVLALACRAEISVIRWRDGLPLDVGRRYRTETPAQRRALTARDRGCRWPGCALPATWCTAHHIQPWNRAGTTRLPNLVLLCFVHHHYFIHQQGWTLTGTPDGLLRFTHPGGWPTLDSPLPAAPASRSP